MAKLHRGLPIISHLGFGNLIGLEFRSLQMVDLEQVLRMRSHPHVAQWFFDPNPPTIAQHLRWAADYFERPGDEVFVLWWEDERRVIGQCALYNQRDREAELGRLMVCPSRQGRGYAKMMVQCVMRDAWSNHDRLTLRLKVNNFAALAVYRKCGFVETKNENGVIEMEARRPD